MSLSPLRWAVEVLGKKRPRPPSVSAVALLWAALGFCEDLIGSPTPRSERRKGGRHRAS